MKHTRRRGRSCRMTSGGDRPDDLLHQRAKFYNDAQPAFPCLYLRRARDIRRSHIFASSRETVPRIFLRVSIVPQCPGYQVISDLRVFAPSRLRVKHTRASRFVPPRFRRDRDALRFHTFTPPHLHILPPSRLRVRRSRPPPARSRMPRNTTVLNQPEAIPPPARKGIPAGQGARFFSRTKYFEVICQRTSDMVNPSLDLWLTNSFRTHHRQPSPTGGSIRI